MIDLEDLCIINGALLKEALVKIDHNAQGLLFVVNEGKLLGVITDGDIRRAIISGKTINDNIEKIYNSDCVSLHHNATIEEIQAGLSDRIKVIPLVDDKGIIVDFASIYRLHRIPVLEPLLGGNELEYVTDCIKSNWISSQGRYVKQFESDIKHYTGAEYVLAVSNGTVALHLALVALGIGPGDEVIVPDLTFGATLNAVIQTGASPVIVDVDKSNWNMSVDLVEANITPKTKAIMPVHIYGVPCNMPKIAQLAKQHNLTVIEDCAEALGSTISEKHVGTFGDAGTFSFFGNKVITCGEGGAVVFKDRHAYERAKVLRDHGMRPDKRYWHEVVGFNYRLTNMQAAVGCAQLEQLSSFRAKRMNIFSWYEKHLMPSGFFERQTIEQGYGNSYWLFTVKLKSHCVIERDSLVEKLAKVGVDTRPVFYPMSEMPAFRDCKTALNGTSKEISLNSISLPTSVHLIEKDIETISAALIKSIESSIKFEEINKSA
ncbi:aminotransferase class I/II-fold pyridoxal phosphate-dependent enzyme [Vibrio sp. Isolate25]|uniref:aminotransferase class I/II-fold pyridoxal phosphate-dependent enzyme n=1 Tax=Vibrio sp. Isolate25 TaxID=2908535 RepID=UPI001EFC2F5D|nr:aminotransferase class I/II-fold pyridoxal phosphate-dependent enzyme [Vibrio sp. Isolate25]MCG9597817.1 aminotransferase class I/II-fold pyridoxal phosphate-dependent enzyme [Vibrio sp. Isolate25]